jgi:hypothetical protein
MVKKLSGWQMEKQDHPQLTKAQAKVIARQEAAKKRKQRRKK